jgi:hypothetical protein
MSSAPFDYGAPLGTKPERVISAEIAVVAPNCVSWSECWDGKEGRKQCGLRSGVRARAGL